MLVNFLIRNRIAYAKLIEGISNVIYKDRFENVDLDNNLSNWPVNTGCDPISNVQTV